MTPEEHQMLVETRAIAEDSAKTLKSIQKMSRISAAVKVIYWVVILGVSFGAFYLIQPYIDAIKGTTGNSGTEQSSSFTDILNDL